MEAFEFTAIAMILVFVIIFMLWRFNSKIDDLKSQNKQLTSRNEFLEKEVNDLKNQISNLKKQ